MEKKDTCKTKCTCKSTYEDDSGLIVVYSTDAKIHHVLHVSLPAVTSIPNLTQGPTAAQSAVNFKALSR